MNVSQLGEFGLIGVLTGLVEKGKRSGEAWKNLIIGIGDDCAAWRCTTGTQVATIDAMVEGVHFRLGMLSWENLGWKSLAVNMSDIAAMGGIPRYALISLGLPEKIEVEDVESLYRGMLDLAERIEVAIVGGNMSRSSSLTINIAAFGEDGPSGRLLTRSGARKGDLVAVTGTLGGAAAGLHLLNDSASRLQPPGSFIDSFARPSPRIKEGLLLAELGIRSAIDISDGLVSDLGHLCKASKLGADVNVDSLPMATGLKERFPDRAVGWALGGGEDYELLFTAPMQTIERVQAKSEVQVTVIGKMVEDPDCEVRLSGSGPTLNAIGWDHFRGK
jgi:thiamine-monophosphate kinase